MLLKRVCEKSSFLKRLKKSSKKLRIGKLKMADVLAMAKKLARFESKVNEEQAGATDVGGGWVRYFDGSGGLWYGFASPQEVADFAANDDGSSPCPFPVVIEEQEGEFQVYKAGQEEPIGFIDAEEVKDALKMEMGSDDEEGDGEEVEIPEEDILAAVLYQASEMV